MLYSAVKSYSFLRLNEGLFGVEVAVKKDHVSGVESEEDDQAVYSATSLKINLSLSIPFPVMIKTPIVKFLSGAKY